MKKFFRVLNLSNMPQEAAGFNVDVFPSCLFRCQLFLPPDYAGCCHVVILFFALLQKVGRPGTCNASPNLLQSKALHTKPLHPQKAPSAVRTQTS